MYQLSHLLTEQRSLLAALASTSLLGSTNSGAASGGENTADITERPDQELQREEEERRRKLTAALEKVEGCVVSNSLIIVLHAALKVHELNFNVFNFI